MRLEFHYSVVLKINPADVQTQVEEIEEHITEVGFIPLIKMERNADNLDSLSHNQVLYNDFDLVVVDYDLGVPGMTGDHVAQAVRSTFGFTDIIFYSGLTAVDLRQLVHDQRIDGVYCLSRPDLSERLATHIDQIVHRLSRLEAMRGLAMGTVGRCDDALKEVLLTDYHARAARERSVLLEQLDDYVKNSVDRQTQRYATCATLEDKLNSQAVTSFHLQKTSSTHYKWKGRVPPTTASPKTL